MQPEVSELHIFPEMGLPLIDVKEEGLESPKNKT
jgi:hypothetical protein